MNLDSLDRRTALRLAGVGAASTLAGCLGDGESDGTPTGTPSDTPTGTPGGSDPSIADHESMEFAVRTSGPEWYHDDEPVGHAVVVDAESRERNVLDGYDLSEEHESEVEDLLEDVDYATDRLVLLESVGPDTCHARLEVADVRIEDGALRADASVVDTSEENEGCGEAVTFASSVLVVGFEGEPLDEVTVEFTDGWDETGTVTASADDPLSTRDPEELPGYVRPDGDPEPVAPLSCDEDGVQRHPQGFDEAAVHWGDVPGEDDYYDDHDGPVLSLRVDDLEYEYGDTVRLTLTNVADGEVDTGNSAKYTLQVYTEDGWQDVRVKNDDRYWEYTDEAVIHQPGEGFEWEFELTEAGIVEDAFHDDARVCPDLQSGRYRFAYFGVIGDGVAAAAFDLTV